MTFSEFVQDQRKPLPLAPTSSSCKGATYIVTGANTGLGFEAAKHLVALSSARVILGVRSLKKGEEAKAKIEAETGIKGVAEVWHLDLTSSDSVKEFAKRVEGLERVDAVIENAGVAMGEWTTAKEGLETTLMVNDVSTLLLAVLVLPKLQESGRRFGVEPHLVVVGSAVAFGAEGELEKIDAEGDILEGLNQPMGMGKRYQTSKLIQLYAVRQLASLRPTSETGVTINFCNPGLCVTELSRNAPFLRWFMIAVMRFLVGRTAEQGSRTLLHAAVAGKESHGTYVSECEIRDYKIPPWVTGDAGSKMQNRVWDSLSKRLNTIQPGCI